MSTHNIPLSIQKSKSLQIVPNLQLWALLHELKNEFETAMVNEPSVFCYKYKNVRLIESPQTLLITEINHIRSKNICILIARRKWMIYMLETGVKDTQLG